MYAGGVKNDDGTITGWRQTDSMLTAAKSNFLSVKQDVKLLNENIVRIIIDETLGRVIKKRNLKPEDIDWYLPHMSSGYFQEKFYNNMNSIGFHIPYERWFTNLFDKGNSGAAAIYIILEELFHSSKLKPGEKILCMVPESGRFSCSYFLLTVE